MSKRKSSRPGAVVYPPVLKDRVKQTQKRIREWGADALLLTNEPDIRYLTGFHGEASWAIVPARSSKLTVISDSRFDEEIDRQAPQVTKVIRKAGLTEEVKKIAGKKSFKRVALQKNHVSMVVHEAIQKKLGKRRLMYVDDGMLDQRAIKDKGEIALIKKAGQIQCEALKKTLKFIKPGMTENVIAGHLEYQMRLAGAEDYAFNSIVAADGNAALPHAIPDKKKVRKGGVLLIDWGAMYEGYRSDMTRTYALGKWPRKMEEVYKIVLEAQLTAIDAIAPGESLKKIDKIARDIITKAGYGKEFGHSLGHGIGLNVHESPNLHKKAKGVLEPNQVVTVEPGIYLRGVGGVRIEDDILVTAKGHKVLTNLPSDFKSAII